METITKNLYEAMFLVDSALAASDWDGIMTDINNILSRADAEVDSIRKWDERKLAYEIKHVTRGTYILCYFKAEGDKIAGIERDTKLAERIMRVLILRADHMSKEEMEKDTPAIAAEKQEQAQAQAAQEAQAKEEAPAETAKAESAPVEEAPAEEAQPEQQAAEEQPAEPQDEQEEKPEQAE